MGRSLKDELLRQYAALQEAGLAPTEMPQEDDTPLVVVESAPRGRAARPRRESVDRYLEDEEANGIDRDRRRGAVRREHRGEGEAGARDRRRPGGPSAARGRGRGRPGEFEPDLAAPSTPGQGGTGPRGPRPGGPPMGGPRPLRPGMGPPRPGMGAPRPGGPPSRTAMLQQRSDQRRRDDDDIAEMRRLLAEFSGQEIDDQWMETFSRALNEETGALPPPHIVVEAIKQSQSADARKIGDAVRAHYRRRPRPPAGGPPPQQPSVPAPA